MDISDDSATSTIVLEINHQVSDSFQQEIVETVIIIIRIFRYTVPSDECITSSQLNFAAGKSRIADKLRAMNLYPAFLLA